MKNFKRYSALYMTFTVLVFVMITAHSASASSLQQGLTAASKSQWEQAHSVRAALRDQDADILTWYLAYQQSPLLSFEEIKAFHETHPDWPRQTRLLVFAEKQMSENMQAAQVTAWFEKNNPRSAKGAIAYARALSAQGRLKDASAFINKWWSEQSLSRDDQKEAFNVFEKQINQSSHIKRLHMLLDEGDKQNANAVAVLLPASYRAFAKARIALQNQSGDVNALIDATPHNLQNDPGFLLDRLTWRRKNDLNDGAIDILNHAPATEQMRQPARWWKERHIIVRRLMENKDYKKAYNLAKAHKQKEGFPQAQAEWVSGFIALEFLHKNWEAFEHFEKLYHAVESPISRSRGAYWAGLASERMGYSDIAAQWYDKALTHGETFYGQLAAERSGKKPHLSFSASGGGERSFVNRQLEKAAEEFVRAHLNDQADLFLRQLAETSKSANDYKQAAQKADSLGFPHIAIAISQKASKEGYWLGDLAYPDRTPDVKNLKDVEWALVHGLIRQESRFDQYAQSPAGALGLMQLMPGTARETAGKLGTGYRKSWLLSKADYNIKLGSSYIERMVARYDGNYALALAAYNAGPGRVDSWIRLNGDPRSDDVDLIKWIESIPIYETRNYVQRVLEAVYVYRQKLKSKQPPPQYPIHIAMK